MESGDRGAGPGRSHVPDVPRAARENCASFREFRSGVWYFEISFQFRFHASDHTRAVAGARHAHYSAMAYGIEMPPPSITRFTHTHTDSASVLGIRSVQ